MNIESTKQTLETILPGIIERLQTAENFAIEQTPIVVQELLAYNLWSNAIWGIVFLIITIFATIGTIRWYKWANEIGDEPSLITMMCGTVIFFLGLLTIVCFEEVIQISIAPRAWLIEYAAELIK